jgi:hypothetical protein
MASCALALCPQAFAQVPAYGRAIPLPVQSLRGEIVFGQPPEVTLNGKEARLAPGARIRDLDNRLLLSGNVVGQKFKVNYVADTYGLLMNVWLLGPAEVAQLWPTTPTEAATWQYNPVSHTWAKP